MKRAMLPFNIFLLRLSPEAKRLMRPVTSLDLFEGNTGQFNEQGLFSTSIFGKLGEKRRDFTYSYIDLRLTVLHPVIYDNIIKLKALNAGIMSGTQYATFNEETGEFEASTILEGDTGYDFFIRHFDRMVFQKTGSLQRDGRIETIEKYRKESLQDAIVVIPASLRELDVDNDGRTRMDEINNIYQRIIALSRTLPRVTDPETASQFDRTRMSIQSMFVQCYEYLESIINNKKGWIQRRYASRRVKNSTRGVLSSRDVSNRDLADPYRPAPMAIAVGMYQLSVSLLPKTKYYLSQGILGEVFDSASEMIRLVDKETLKSTPVELSSTTIDRWYTSTGFEATIQAQRDPARRHRPVEINGHYLALVYVSATHFKVFRDIDELPEGFNRDCVHPITLIELIYISGFKHWNVSKAIGTRYPVSGMGSTIPTDIYVMTTTPAGKRTRLDEDWLPVAEDVAPEYPIFNKDNIEHTQYHDTLAIPAGGLSGQGADFDGDTESFQAVYVDDSISEMARYLKRREAYLTPKGTLAFSANIHTVALAVRNMSGFPNKLDS